MRSRSRSKPGPSPVPLVLAVVLVLASAPAVAAAEFRLEMAETTWELRPGLSTRAWSFGGSVPGTPIVVRRGEPVRIEVVNRLPVPTNVHWHGLVVPHDQDGPSIEIKPGEARVYEFVAGESGTYWYHPHRMPVLPQLDRGLYGAFIVKAPEDELYSGDHTYVLDDWYLDARGARIEGLARGDMERLGNVETVNGKTAEAIPALRLRHGELHKLRFVNASTAAFHTVVVSGHRFRVTHSDGHPLERPYSSDRIELAPGERVDAELFAGGAAGERFEMRSGRRVLGIAIPVVYEPGSVASVTSPFVVPDRPPLLAKPLARPDIVLDFASAMGMSGGGMMHGGMMDGGGMTRWTIDGRSYPDTDPVAVSRGEVVTMRLRNRDMMGMVMGHRMDHPIHLHGTYFQVLSVNGVAPEGVLWKDTVPVPEGGYVDIAFVMPYAGDWPLHCHVIDHEDGGMMLMVRAR